MTGLARPAAAAATLLVFLSTASAHVLLDRDEAPAGTSFKLGLRVPHGCSGAATTRLRVRVPEAFASAKPQPKPGWVIDVVGGPAPAGTDAHAHGHGHEGTAPAEIAWTGRLEDGSYDEFVLWVSTPKTAPAGVIHVPVVQECGDKVHRWIEIPAAGKPAERLDSPAPSLRLIPRPS